MKRSSVKSASSLAGLCLLFLVVVATHAPANELGPEAKTPELDRQLAADAVRIASSGGAGGPGAPANDDCDQATPIPVPGAISGTTDGASIDSEAGFCGTSVTSPGVWHTVIGTGNTMTATTCSTTTDYDSKLSVYCNGCEVLTCVGGNDDDFGCSESILHSTVSWASEPGAEYLILVHGFGGATGAYEVQVSDDGTPATGAVFCGTLELIAVPTLSGWSLALLGLVLLGVGTTILQRRLV